MMVALRRLRRFDEYPLEEYVMLFSAMPLFALTPAEVSAWVGKLLENGVVRVLDVDGHLGGFHGYYANDAVGRICYGAGLVVAATLRGSGWGSRLMAMAFDDARSKGMVAYTSNVVKGNIRALAFYRRLGLMIVGPGRDDDHVLVRRDLS